MHIHEQTTDPTRYRFPELWSPNRENHIRRLEDELKWALIDSRICRWVAFILAGLPWVYLIVKIL